jgi:hypothetical protein
MPSSLEEFKSLRLRVLFQRFEIAIDLARTEITVPREAQLKADGVNRSSGRRRFVAVLAERPQRPWSGDLADTSGRWSAACAESRSVRTFAHQSASVIRALLEVLDQHQVGSIPYGSVVGSLLPLSSFPLAFRIMR